MKKKAFIEGLVIGLACGAFAACLFFLL